MELTIEHHLAISSQSKNVIALDRLRISKVGPTIHKWVQKANLDPRGRRFPDNVAVYQKVVKVDGERFGFVSRLRCILHPLGALKRLYATLIRLPAWMTQPTILTD
jgi:hypothetical protein